MSTFAGGKLQARLAALMTLVVVAAPPPAQADARAVSAVSGIHRVTLTSGPNFVSVPFYNRAAFRGAVSGTTANTITFSPSPAWSASQFGPRDGLHQYLVIVVSDASAQPGVAGDWWHITANTAAALTVDAGADDLATHLAAGDVVEVRRLTSVKDVFGSGADVLLNKDVDFDFLVTQEDILRVVEGTSFGAEIVYHAGPPDEDGWYYNGNRLGNGDGSTITFNPGQPFMVFRKTGSPPLTVTTRGAVHDRPFTHYLSPGPNPVALAHPMPAVIGDSHLKQSGWASDLDFDVLTTQEDVGRAVVGTSFADEIFHYAGPDDVNGWYVNGVLDDGFPFEPTRGYVLFIKGPGALAWRQAVPFNP